MAKFSIIFEVDEEEMEGGDDSPEGENTESVITEFLEYDLGYKFISLSRVDRAD